MSYFEEIEDIKNLSPDIKEVLLEYSKDMKLDMKKDASDFIIDKAILHSKYLTPLTSVRNRILKLENDLIKLLKLKERYYGKGVSLSKEQLKKLDWELDPFKGLEPPKTEIKLQKILDNDIHVIDLKTKIATLKIDESVLLQIIKFIEYNFKVILDKFFEVKYNKI